MHIKSVLEELGVTPSKRRGQNFLTDVGAARRIAAFSGIAKDDAVLEIGPGLGVLTRALCERTSRLAVVEIEEAFCGYITREFPEIPAQRVYFQDALKLKAETITTELGATSFAVVSNVPYSISSEVILWILNNRQVITSASLLLQMEFAERIAAGPGSRTYGSLSVLRALYADASLGPKISGTSFHPRANVDSVVLKLDLHEPSYAVADQALFERLVRGAFGQRRKTVANSLHGSRIFDSKEHVAAALQAAGIDPGCRAETLSVKDYAALTAVVQNKTFCE